MGLARSTYYDVPQAQPIGKARLVEEIKAVCAEWPAYGYRRVTFELHEQGHVINHKKVMRLMKENGLSVRARRRFMVTTDSNHDGPIFPNLAKDIVPTGVNQLWVADITYITIATGSSISPQSLMPGRGVLSAMRSARGSTHGWRSPHCAPLSAPADRQQAASIIPIVARSTLPKTIAPSSPSSASRAPWAGAEIRTTTPRPRAS
jgi:hypothetical protein